MVIGIFLLTAGIAVAVDETASISWEQPCVDGCTGFGAVQGWHIYMSDISGSYGATPIIIMPYDGTATPTYTSTYVLTLTGAGTKYFIIRAFNTNGESGNSNEATYDYNFLTPNTPVNLIFTIQSP